MNQVQPGEACEKTRLYLDSYVSNELLIETNHEVLRHLEACPACAAEAEARSRLRSRLKAAVEGQTVPADLQARIRQRLEPRRRFGWWTAGMVAAAAAVLFLVLSDPRASLPSLTDRPAQTAYIEKVSANVAAVLRVGLRDHVHCAVFRRYPKDPPSVEQMVQDLGPAYQGLLPLLQAAAPERLPLRDGAPVQLRRPQIHPPHAAQRRESALAGDYAQGCRRDHGRHAGSAAGVRDSSLRGEGGPIPNCRVRDAPATWRT